MVKLDHEQRKTKKCVAIKRIKYYLERSTVTRVHWPCLTLVIFLAPPALEQSAEIFTPKKKSVRETMKSSYSTVAGMNIVLMKNKFKRQLGSFP